MASTDLTNMKEDQSRDGQETTSKVNKFEVNLYGDKDGPLPQIDVSNMTEPRLFGTHMPFPSLPKSVKESNCKIIYICRNPFDTFVSYWIFINKIRLRKSLTELTLEESFERYCKGICLFGPFWDNMLGYLKESIERPDRVLFLKYEDLKEDVNFHTKRIAEFVGIPFTQEEENNGVIENIIKLCSFESMKEIEGNQSGTISGDIEKEFYFRKGEIGDWANYLSSSMVEKLSKVMEEKLNGSSLSFKVCA
ncbi:putative P-loop containing nucleoside triphosphate hydrolase [Medicago truncatula]|uniref:Sulfotransferase n=1 Tax=Medicago truncatula TaxID=3880 RepID=A0A072TNZ0_MEDTR|nr:cytosolic sulfotransferase 15 isoform X2 [Medicago truncatula]KEH19132.1 sulfotransferase [Medicago truncatula]RHN40359.1 putative P-loop containing nucleoside triphosphate hydrolase [Medicago truncatula]